MSENTKAPLSQLEATLEEYLLHKAPYQLPQDAKEAIVKFAPWIVIIFMVLSLPLIFGALAATSLFGAVAVATGGTSLFWVIPTLVLIASLIYNLLALPGLFNRTMTGWKYTYYAQLLSVLSTLLTGNIVGALVGAVIGFYILFQVKSLYK